MHEQCTNIGDLISHELEALQDDPGFQRHKKNLEQRCSGVVSEGFALDDYMKTDEFSLFAKEFRQYYCTHECPERTYCQQYYRLLESTGIQDNSYKRS